MGKNPLDNSVGVSIHAGFPNPGEDYSHIGLDLNQLLVHHPVSTYNFRIEGNDWETFGVFNGDIAIIDRALDPLRTDLVIWWKGSEFAISRLSRLPHNASIWGVITAIVHLYREGGR